MDRKNRQHALQINSRTFSPKGTVCTTGFFAIIFIFCTAFALAQGSGKKDLKLFYKQNCVGCHGVDGSAHDENGDRLKGEDFTNLEWQRDTSDDEMIKVILKGKFFGMAMPAYKDKLTNEEVEKLVTEVIRKSKKGKVIAPDAE